MANDSAFYLYASRFGANRRMPESGRPRDEIMAELRQMDSEENAVWKKGLVSGTMYCGDLDHFAWMNETNGLFLHMNSIQRDICPSATRFEGRDRCGHSS